MVAETRAASDDTIDEIEVDMKPALIEVPQPKPRVSVASDPLAPFMALSAEEKIALFT